MRSINVLMYLLDTNVISERRKGKRVNSSVQHFFVQAIEQEDLVFISSIAMGELRRGVEMIRHRGDKTQADQLEAWLQMILRNVHEIT